MTFWLRRCTEQSRTPSAQAVPCPSAMTCTSTCRAPVTSRSRKTTPEPNARCGLVAGALVGVGEVGVGGDHADAAAAAAGGGLEHQRVADPRGRRRGVLEGVDPAAAPRGDGHADLLGDQLGADLVAQLAHRLRARPDEGDADPGAQLGEGRVLGDEAPADPGGVGAGLAQRPLEHGVVEVGPARPPGRGCRPWSASRTNIAAPLAVGVQRDRLDPVAVGARLRR